MNVRGTKVTRRGLLSYLVEDRLRSVGKGDVLLEAIANLFQLLALGPVVESAGNVDLLGSVGPARERNPELAIQCTYAKRALGKCGPQSNRVAAASGSSTTKAYTHGSAARAVPVLASPGHTTRRAMPPCDNEILLTI